MFDFNDDERDQLFLNNDTIKEFEDNTERSTERATEVDEQGVTFKGYEEWFPTHRLEKYATGKCSNAEYSDKGVFPEGILKHIHRTEGSCSEEPEVLVFEAIWGGRRMCCGVLEFCAGEAAYLPSWVMDALGCTDGAHVWYRLVSVEPAQYLRLKPLSERFWTTKDMRRFLEEGLYSYTTLNKGTTFAVPDPAAPGTSMLFHVSDARPGRAVRVVDADPEVELDTSETPGGVSVSACNNAVGDKFEYSQNQSHDRTKKRDSRDGHRLNEGWSKDNNWSVCESCGKRIPTGNIRVHTLRCGHAKPEQRETKTTTTTTMPEIKSDGEGTEVCKYCGVAVALVDIVGHTKECGARTVKCEECGRLVRRAEMDLHTQTRCAYTSDFFGSLNINTNALSGLLEEKTLKDDRQFEERYSGENVYMCPKCQEAYFNETEYLEHMSMCLEDGQSGETAGYSVLAERKHVCPVCGKKFHKKNKLKEHMHKTHH